MKIAGPRLALRPLRDEDLPAVSARYEGSIAGAQRLAIVAGDDATPLGVLEYRLDDGWLSLGALAVEPSLLGRGYRSEAVRLLEEAARERGLAKRFRAFVAAGDGLGLYFWLRLGYRPACPGEEPWRWAAAGDIMALVRVWEGES